MQQVNVSAARWQQDSDGAWLCLRVQSPRSAMAICDELKPGGEYTAQIKRKIRSLNANAYAWVLIDRLAEHFGLNREDVYREEIKLIPGVSDVVCIPEKSAELFCKNWAAKGIGWMAETFPSKLDGCVCVTCWYGSSTYDTGQMARLIDAIVEDCKEAGIETMTPQQLDALKSRWGEVKSHE